MVRRILLILGGMSALTKEVKNWANGTADLGVVLWKLDLHCWPSLMKMSRESTCRPGALVL